MLLDLEIRARTKNQKSLDDVMRYLMENYASKGVGFRRTVFCKPSQRSRDRTSPSSIK